MSISRRQFVEVASLTLLAGMARPASIAESAQQPVKSPARPPSIDESPSVLVDASEETFKPYIGDRFVVSKGAQALGSVTLRAVVSPQTASSPTNHPGKSRWPNASATPVKTFSLQFRGTGKPIPQGTYTMSNPSMGNFPLFIVPGAPGINPMSYTATFTFLQP